MFLQPMIPPERFDIFSHCVGCSEGLDAFRFFFKLNGPKSHFPGFLHGACSFFTICFVVDAVRSLGKHVLV